MTEYTGTVFELNVEYFEYLRNAAIKNLAQQVSLKIRENT